MSEWLEGASLVVGVVGLFAGSALASNAAERRLRVEARAEISKILHLATFSEIDEEVLANPRFAAMATAQDQIDDDASDDEIQDARAARAWLWCATFIDVEDRVDRHSAYLPWRDRVVVYRFMDHGDLGGMALHSMAEQEGLVRDEFGSRHPPAWPDSIVERRRYHDGLRDYCVLRLRRHPLNRFRALRTQLQSVGSVRRDHGLKALVNAV